MERNFLQKRKQFIQKEKIVSYIYALLPHSHNIGEQEALAKAEGAHLVTINSAEENEFLVNTFLNSSIQGAIIGYYAPLEGGWRWISGETSSYINWTSGYPSSNFYRDAVIYYPWGGTWYDDFIGHNGPAIMERVVLAPVPEPSSLLLLVSGFLGTVGSLRKRFKKN